MPVPFFVVRAAAHIFVEERELEKTENLKDKLNNFDTICVYTDLQKGRE